MENLNRTILSFTLLAVHIICVCTIVTLLSRPACTYQHFLVNLKETMSSMRGLQLNQLAELYFFVSVQHHLFKPIEQMMNHKVLKHITADGDLTRHSSNNMKDLFLHFWLPRTHNTVEQKCLFYYMRNTTNFQAQNWLFIRTKTTSQC